jgi:sRNA-binding carbon storage regulator CsrA
MDPLIRRVAVKSFVAGDGVSIVIVEVSDVTIKVGMDVGRKDF